MKVGQTFLSAVLVIGLPEGSRKKGLRRPHRANTRCHAVRRGLAWRATMEAFVKVGQTFLSAVLVIGLPEGSRKKGFRRPHRANTRCHAVRRGLAWRATMEAFVKVGQTFLSAVLVIGLPEGSRKKGFRRPHRANTRCHAVRHLRGSPRCSGRSANTAFRCAPRDHRIRRAR